MSNVRPRFNLFHGTNKIRVKLLKLNYKKEPFTLSYIFQYDSPGQRGLACKDLWAHSTLESTKLPAQDLPHATAKVHSTEELQKKS